jgi:hypothetical protein
MFQTHAAGAPFPAKNDMQRPNLAIHYAPRRGYDKAGAALLPSQRRRTNGKQ